MSNKFLGNLHADTPPAAPSDLTATTVSSAQIDLAWVDNSSDENGFKIEQSPDDVIWTQIGEAKQTGPHLMGSSNLWGCQLMAFSESPAGFSNRALAPSSGISSDKEVGFHLGQPAGRDTRCFEFSKMNLVNATQL